MAKEMTTVVLTEQKWNAISQKLYEGCKPSERIISWKHKETFGFIMREYWAPYEHAADSGLLIGKNRALQIHLDFYDEAAATLFRLRWL